MAYDAVAPAILEYVDHGAYPDSEDIASTELNPSVLNSLHSRLLHAQDEVKAEIRSISKGASADIDTWIARAKELQADILKSRETARQIVEEAEKGKELKSKVEDRRRKVELLEQEIEFQGTVEARLEHVRYANNVLSEVQDCLVQGNVQRALNRLEVAEGSIHGLVSSAGQDSGVATVLGRRLDGLKQKLVEAVTEGWTATLKVNIEDRRVEINDGLENFVAAAQSLDIFKPLLGKFAKDFERAILKPRLTVNRGGRVHKINIAANDISCEGTGDNTSFAALFRDLNAILDFLSTHLPASVSAPLAESLMPNLSTRLEETWLEPSVPMDIADMTSFQALLVEVTRFADHVDALRWHGSNFLREWVQSAPKTWLTKRREILLGDVRNLVFSGLRETKQVERVETQMVATGDALAEGGQGGDDDWDTAWDEPEESPAPLQDPHPVATTDADEEEASAWELPEEDDAPNDTREEEDDAWGWGDAEENSSEKPPSPEIAKKQPPNVNGDNARPAPSEREVTLRETFRVTAVPDGVLELIRKVITDAGTLTGPEFASSPIAPASTALYTLPTLALAIYRATAPTAYNKLDTGNMLIYNDANRLSDQLRSWQASQPPSSRLRLDNDVKALDQFAKRAYSAEMDSQRTILRDLLDGAQGFSNCTTQPFRGECESAVEQTIDRLRDVHRQWSPILSSSALLQSTGSLLATITGKMLVEFEDLPDIGEAESKQLKALCDRVTAAKDLFAQSGGQDGSEVRDMTFIYCPNWLKFQYLAEIMESSLADIKYLWNEGELSLEFEGEEVVGLIEALFAESGLRRQAIAEIRRGGRR